MKCPGIAADEGIEGGGQEDGGDDGQRQGEGVEQKAFGQELDDEVEAEGAEDFPEADLAGSFEGPGGGEVGIVDPGDGDDEEGDEEEEADRFPVAIDLGFLVIVGKEVNVAQWDEVEFAADVVLLMPLVVVHID